MDPILLAIFVLALEELLEQLADLETFRNNQG
jgi:hypothetical protein